MSAAQEPAAHRAALTRPIHPAALASPVKQTRRRRRRPSYQTRHARHSDFGLAGSSLVRKSEQVT